MSQMEILYLSRSDVAAVGLSMEEVISLVERALIEHGQKRIQMPPSSGVSPGGGAFIHAMPAYLPRLKVMGMKWVSIAPHHLATGLDRITGLLILNDPETTLPICALDCAWITAMRTAAVSGVAAKFLAHPEASTAAIIGAGVQGRTNLLALQEVLPNLKQVRVYDINPAALKGYCQEMKPLVGVSIEPAGSIREAVKAAHVVVTATPVQPKPRPLVEDEWFGPGGLAIPLEIDSAWPRSTFEGVDKFICDDRRQLQHASRGDFPVHFFSSGLPAIYAELGEVVCGQKPGRENNDERIVSLNMGMGIHDVTVGGHIYRIALEKGIGTRLPL